MKLYEYQSKSRFAEFGIPIPEGKLANTPDEAFEIAHQFDTPIVIKAQILNPAGNKVDEAKVAFDPETARQYTLNILDTDSNGQTAHKVLIEPVTTIAAKVYLAVILDREMNRPVMVASALEGTEIGEEKHHKLVETYREAINPFLGILEYQTYNLASGINLPHEHWRAFTKIAKSLFDCYVASDAVRAEINPLVITQEGDLLALNGNIIIDDYALYRQPILAEMRDTDGESNEETLARRAGLNYVRLNGQIGCLVSGAGLAMTTMDIIRLYGGEEIRAASVLDIGDSAQANKIAVALNIVVSDQNVKSILFNIFGGLTRCDEIARAILEALNEVKINRPTIIIRLAGLNAAEGRAILDRANLPKLSSAATLTKAALIAIDAAKENLHGDPGR